MEQANEWKDQVYMYLVNICMVIWESGGLEKFKNLEDLRSYFGLFLELLLQMKLSC